MSRSHQLPALLARCARGDDERAWSLFLDEFGPALKAGVRRVLRRAGLPARRAVCEDLLQEVYCRLLERRGRILRRCRATDAAMVAAYLGRVAESVTVDRLRRVSAAKRGRDRLVHLHDEVAEPAWRPTMPASRGPEGRLLARERRRRAFDRCRDLVGGRSPRRDLAVLYLAYCRGLTSREIAARLGGLTAQQVDSLVYRVRRRLARGGIRIPRRE